MREIGRLVLVLGLICSLSASSLAYLRTTLAPLIEKQSDLYVRGPALERLFGLPAEDLLGRKIIISAQGGEYPVFYLKADERVTGLAVEAAGRGGYGGNIVIMIGLDLDTDRMLGVEIVSHSETPGLGAQVEKPGFRKQWTGLTLDQPIALRDSGGQVDAISGATFSSTAMIDGTRQVVELIRNRRAEILAQIAEQ